MILTPAQVAENLEIAKDIGGFYKAETSHEARWQVTRQKLDNPFRFNHKPVPVFHDHLEGSAHCVECGGDCKLTDPTQQALTSLIRWLFEGELNFGNKIPYPAIRFLTEIGVDVERLRSRARNLQADVDDAQGGAR